ncbi:putative ATP-binding cassette transporter/putative ATP-binding cassette transporter [Chryseobacterium rhizoplanae]|uniref:Putative ATP-binding cassette transporter/putative ATP-binding cassette transporter n=1 Tax=Chryseobacterium rhizoplanae TaxID=1609531 RepID=A0A521EHT2_9FLAO|nr:cyclic peptide export ABC transporter [Chryseobacterium rhizoplanae]SMO83455.1 putative ATP-binding cassette transporter/putative ATP-binding cassette transporter [Chryseobacterium rhizoplanae]
MFILKIFQNRSKLFYLALLLLGIINSLTSTVLLMFIQSALQQKPFPILPGYGWATFTGSLVIAIVSTKIFQTYIVKLTQEILYDYELNVLEKLRFTSYFDFQNLGSQRIYTAINDVRVLAMVPEVLVVMINSSILVFCALGYMFWISPVGGASMLSLMICLLVFYMFRNNVIKNNLNKVRDLQDTYHKYLLDLLNGFKEVKMSISRNENLFNKYLKANRVEARAIGQKTAIRYLDNELIGRYSWYIALGVVLFVLPTLLNMNAMEYSPFIIVVLFLMGPLSLLVGILSHLNNIKVAITRIEKVEADINVKSNSVLGHGDLTEINKNFDELIFDEVTYKYFDELKKSTFIVGPINLTIKKGEVIFITGGNGSGKSTFINLLTGLYKVTSGAIYLNGTHITPQLQANYRNQFAAIFTNNYLFEENYNDFELHTGNEDLMAYTEIMRLKGILKIDDLGKKISNGLSKGQSKRLALIYALMEQRQIFVLDEWAAEQDPIFRAYFYEKILVDLKNMGKTVIAVTHDDHYFQHCDRILKFDYGKIIEDKAVLKRREFLAH